MLAQDQKVGGSSPSERARDFKVARSGPPRLPVPDGWRAPIDDWLTFLAAFCSSNTVVSRRQIIENFARFVGGCPGDVVPSVVDAWLAVPGISRETRRNRRYAVLNFFRWAASVGLVAGSPAEGTHPIRSAIPFVRPIPEQVLADAYAAADERTRLILRLAAEAGLRRAEIAGLLCDRLTRGEGGWSLEVLGKGDRWRVVPITDSLAWDVKRAADASATRHVFPSVYGGALTAAHVAKLAAAVIPKPWTLHTLRHRYATRVYLASSDLLSCQKLLGHSSVGTTQRYVAMPDDRLRAAVAGAELAIGFENKPARRGGALAA